MTMAMDIETCCQWRVTGEELWNPTSAKTGQIWGHPSVVTHQDMRN
jgi:hypothetical protein